MELVDYFLAGGNRLISFIAVISVIVFIHEYGHFIVARWCGVKIETFSIGFGKEIFGWNDKHGTRWKFSMFPLGGYVKMFGDEGAASTPDNEKIQTMSPEEEAVAFHTKPLWKKSLIVGAGPAANFILAIVVLTFFFMAYGRSVSAPIISEVIEESAASQAGLMPGDRIKTIDGTKVETFRDIAGIVSIRPEQELTFAIERDGKEVQLVVVPKLTKSQDMLGNDIEVGTVGIVSHEVEFQEISGAQALPAAVAETWSISVRTLEYVWLIITGRQKADELSGVLRIAKYSGQAVEKGFTTVLMLVVVISINLGLVNLFPIPMLDGGHLLYYAIEAVRGKPMAEQAQEFGFKIGFAIIILLMVFATWNDLRHFGVM